MIIGVEQLTNDFKQLRRGLGLDAPDLTERIPDTLCNALGLEQRDPDLRDGLKRAIRQLAESLPGDDRRAVLVAFRLAEDCQHRHLKQRVEMLAEEIARDYRTADRRVGEALAKIAEVAIVRRRPPQPDPSSSAAVPWRTVAMRTWVKLDGAVPEIQELRRISASTDGLAEAELELSVPKPPDWIGQETTNPRLEVLSGGTLHTRLRRSRTRIGHVLTLPRPLARDEEHEFFLRFTFQDPDAMDPFYACTPTFPCSAFDLSIRFGTDRVPDRIWRLSGALVSEVTDQLAPREPVQADDAGEVHLSFTDLTPHVSWGAVWSR